MFVWQTLIGWVIFQVPPAHLSVGKKGWPSMSALTSGKTQADPGVGAFDSFSLQEFQVCNRQT